MAFLNEFYECNFRKLLYAALSKPLKPWKSHRRVTSKRVEKKVRSKKSFFYENINRHLESRISKFRWGHFLHIFFSCEKLQIEKEETANVEQKKILGISVDLAQIISWHALNLGKGKGVVAKTPGTPGF